MIQTLIPWLNTKNVHRSAPNIPFRRQYVCNLCENFLFPSWIDEIAAFDPVLDFDGSRIRDKLFVSFVVKNVKPAHVAANTPTVTAPAFLDLNLSKMK